MVYESSIYNTIPSNSVLLLTTQDINYINLVNMNHGTPNKHIYCAEYRVIVVIIVIIILLL